MKLIKEEVFYVFQIIINPNPGGACHSFLLAEFKGSNSGGDLEQAYASSGW
jgi:hypothetical protein